MHDIKTLNNLKYNLVLYFKYKYPMLKVSLISCYQVTALKISIKLYEIFMICLT